MTTPNTVDALMTLVDEAISLAFERDLSRAIKVKAAVEASARALAAIPAAEQLSELMRGLEIPPGAAALPPAALYATGRAIAEQAKSAQQAGGVPAGSDLVTIRLPTLTPEQAADVSWCLSEALVDAGRIDDGRMLLFVGEASAPSAVQPLSEAQFPDVIVSAYTITEGFSGIKVERAQQVVGPAKWAVRKSGSVLGRSGAWEWEPMPSSRTDEWLAEYRFDTADDAIAAGRRAALGIVTKESST